MAQMHVSTAIYVLVLHSVEPDISCTCVYSVKVPVIFHAYVTETFFFFNSVLLILYEIHKFFNILIGSLLFSVCCKLLIRWLHEGL